MELSHTNIKELRRDLKNLGYKLKTYTNSFGVFGEIQDQNKKYIYGSSNVFTKEHTTTHKTLFEYINKKNL